MNNVILNPVIQNYNIRLILKNIKKGMRFSLENFFNKLFPIVYLKSINFYNFFFIIGAHSEGYPVSYWYYPASTTAVPHVQQENG